MMLSIKHKFEYPARRVSFDLPREADLSRKIEGDSARRVKFEQGFPQTCRFGWGGGRAGGVRRLDSTKGYSQIF